MEESGVEVESRREWIVEYIKTRVLMTSILDDTDFDTRGKVTNEIFELPQKLKELVDRVTKKDVTNQELEFMVDNILEEEMDTVGGMWLREAISEKLEFSPASSFFGTINELRKRVYKVIEFTTKDDSQKTPEIGFERMLGLEHIEDKSRTLESGETTEEMDEMVVEDEEEEAFGEPLVPADRRGTVSFVDERDMRIQREYVKNNKKLYDDLAKNRGIGKEENFLRQTLLTLAVSQMFGRRNGSRLCVALALSLWYFYFCGAGIFQTLRGVMILATNEGMKQRTMMMLTLFTVWTLRVSTPALLSSLLFRRQGLWRAVAVLAMMWYVHVMMGDTAVFLVSLMGLGVAGVGDFFLYAVTALDLGQLALVIGLVLSANIIDMAVHLRIRLGEGEDLRAEDKHFLLAVFLAATTTAALAYRTDNQIVRVMAVALAMLAVLMVTFLGERELCVEFVTEIDTREMDGPTSDLPDMKGTREEDGIRIDGTEGQKKDAIMQMMGLLAAVFGAYVLSENPLMSIPFFVFGVIAYGHGSGGFRSVDTFGFSSLSVEREDYEGSMRSGLYRIYQKGIIGDTQIAVGYVTGGVFHTVFHGTKAATLVFEGKNLKPVEYSVLYDYVTYGGEWRAETLTTNGVVLAALRPRETMVRIVYPIGVMSLDTDEVPYMRADHPVGTSGSPIFSLSGEFVGLFGNGFVKDGDFHSILIKKPEGEGGVRPVHDETKSSGKPRREIIDWHPGRGKTRNYIIQQVKKNQVKKMRTWILTPTRVVMGEVVSALTAEGISHGTRKSSLDNCMVVVMCHATFSHAMVLKPSRMRAKVHVIMDEAHYLDPMSIAARGMMDNMHRNGANVSYLTATPPGFAGRCASNFTIWDYEVKDLRQICVSKLKEGKKVVWFVPTIRLTQELAAKYEGVALNRNTFENSYQLAKSEKTRLVVTTDISEMGANFNADVVLDSGTRNVPVILDQDLDEERVELRLQQASNASLNQRRGRIGRRKDGHYYKEKIDDISQVKEAAWVEAQMILDAMGLCAMMEEMENFEAPLRYALENEKTTQKFLEDVFSDYEKSPTIWLAWKIRNARKDPFKRDWLFGGRNVWKPYDKMKEVFSTDYIDGRITKESKFLNSITASGPGAKPALRSYKMFLFGFWNPALDFLKARVSEASVLFMEHDGLVAEEVEKETEKAKTALTLLILGAFVVLIVTVKTLKGLISMITPKQVAGVAVADLTGVAVALGCVGMWTQGVHPAFCFLSYVGYSLMDRIMSLTSGTRSYLDIQLFQYLAIIFGVLMVLLAWELEMLPNIRNDLTSVFHREAAERETTTAFEMQISILACGVAYYWMTVWCEPLRTEVFRDTLGEMLASRTTAKDKMNTVLKQGFSFELLDVRRLIPLTALLIGTWSKSTIVGFSWFLVPLMVLISSDRSRAARQAINVLFCIETKDGAPEESRLTPYEEKFLGKLFHGFYVLGVVMLLNVTSEMMQFTNLAVVALASLRMMGWEKNKDLSISILFSMVAIGSGHIYWGCISLVISFVSQSSRLRSIKAEVRNEGMFWKEKMNALTQDQFNKYRFYGVPQVTRGDYVSKGGLKIQDLCRQAKIRPKGVVYDLGCGRGAFSQYAAMQADVLEVKAFTIGGQGHELPQKFLTYGHNLVVFKDRTDAYSMEPQSADFIMCDIGESDPSYYREEARTMRNLDLLERWKERNPEAGFIVKVLCPYMTKIMRKLETMQLKHGGGLYRTRFSRNSTMEMYYVSGERNSMTTMMLQQIRIQTRRLTSKEAVGVEMTGPVLKMGTRKVENKSRDIPERGYIERLQQVQKEHKDTWHYDEQNPYRTFKYLGSYAAPETGNAGQGINQMIRRIMWPWEKIMKVTKIAMTDTTTDGQQQILREKVDTQVCVPPDKYRKLNKWIMEWLVERFNNKGLKPRILTRDEFMRNVRNDAAVGGWSRDIPWNTVQEAINDESFWRMVDEERERHLNGTCRYCIFNTMGKKEKKPQLFGRSKGSRTIWYLWLGGRFLEYEALGFLNEDHWVARENLEAGVGGMSVDKLGYVLRDIAGRCSHLYADDVAGWDTRLSEEDLEDEELISTHAAEYHKKLINAQYRVVYRTKVAMFPRKSKRTQSGTVIDVVVRKDQRGSGETPTYAMNTISNLKCILGRILESHSLLSEKMTRELVFSILNRNGKEWMSNTAVAGDDMVVGAGEGFSTALDYINSTGKIRKDIELNEPSPAITDWEKVSFCSHHYHEVGMKDGRSLVVPCRDEHEIVGRSRIQKGGPVTIRESCGMAKAYAQMWLIYFFHRRDLRSGGLAVCSAVPSRWVPTGKTSWSVHQKHEWMTNEDMLSVWNRVWIYDNIYMEDKTPVKSWEEIPYLHKGQDIECGSLIGTTDRSNWAKELPSLVIQARKAVGIEDYSDYLSSMGRYKNNTRIDSFI